GEEPGGPSPLPSACSPQAERDTPFRGVGSGHQHLADDVDGGVGGDDVAAEHVDAVDGRAVLTELEHLAVDGFGGPGIGQGGRVVAVTGDHVVGEDRGQHLLVGQHRGQVVFGNGGEGVVHRSEDGERAIAVQRVDQTGLTDRGHQGGEQRVVAGGGGGGIVGHAGERAFPVHGHRLTRRTEGTVLGHLFSFGRFGRGVGGVGGHVVRGG